MLVRSSLCSVGRNSETIYYRLTPRRTSRLSLLLRPTVLCWTPALPENSPHWHNRRRRHHRVKELWEQPSAALDLHVASHVSRQPSIFSSSITAQVFPFSLFPPSCQQCLLSSVFLLYSKKSNQESCPQMVAFLTAPAMLPVSCIISCRSQTALLLLRFKNTSSPHKDFNRHCRLFQYFHRKSM